jgi:hypothetical protein
MAKVYRYVGPPEIMAKVPERPVGTPILCPADVAQWAATSGQVLRRGELLAATYVVDPPERFLIADRHSEHVACAAGGEVLAAGEVFFDLTGPQVSVVQITNQSTGYCPEPDSWGVVDRALRTIGLPHPAGFTMICIFRRCPACGTRNIVKDGWYYCDVCGQALPKVWNFGSEVR